jgi:hypothetical protein
METFHFDDKHLKSDPKLASLFLPSLFLTPDTDENREWKDSLLFGNPMADRAAVYASLDFPALVGGVSILSRWRSDTPLHTTPSRTASGLFSRPSSLPPSTSNASTKRLARTSSFAHTASGARRLLTSPLKDGDQTSDRMMDDYEDEEDDINFVDDYDGDDGQMLEDAEKGMHPEDEEGEEVEPEVRTRTRA